MSLEVLKTILMASLDQDFRRQLLEAFAAEPYRLVLAATADEAWAELDRHRPDLVLLDASSPDLESYELCRRLKARDDIRNIPVVLIDSATEEERILRGFDVGADDLLRKPLSIAYLKTKIRIWLARGERSWEAGPGV